MAQSKEIIIKEIRAHINKEGSGYTNWYIGISINAERRLFEEHNVSIDKGWWIYHVASSSKVAREVEGYFLDLGCDGGFGGGDDDSDMVYAYKKTNYTNQ